MRGMWVRVSLPAILAASAFPVAGTGEMSQLLGTWNGTSTCVNRQIAPACKDETVVYEVRRSEKPDSAILAADKIVDGKRVPMGELEFVYSEKDGCWRSEFTTPRVQGVWCLVVDGNNMTGSLRVQPENADVRKVQLTHARPPDRPNADASEPSVRWPIPTGWKHETFALPPEFAPEFPYHGIEDLRFMPGFSSPTAPDFWSYDFVWWLDKRPPFDATSMAEALTTYFRGLSTAVGASKYQLDPARYRVVLTPAPDSAPPRLTGQVFTYDPFATGLPIVLNVEAELRSCTETGQVAVVMALSPKDTTDSVWKALRATAGTLVCSVVPARIVDDLPIDRNPNS